MKVVKIDEKALCERISTAEVLRYSKCRDAQDTELCDIAKVCVKELCSVITPMAVYAETEVHFTGNAADFGFFETESASLRKFLGGDCRARVFAATLGIGADRLISRYSPVLPSKAVIMDGAATAGIEAFCDYICEEIFRVPACERFSPGYGDLPLELQREVISLLNAQLSLGLSLTDSLLLTPTKSVTAIVRSL
ncbi:MAG: hypothetical protein ACI4GZ_01775 [Ruminococcus sp.]